jgi:Fe-S-cluster-containing hydrogenase component 2
VTIQTKRRARSAAVKKGRKGNRGRVAEPQPVSAAQLRTLSPGFLGIDDDSLEALASRALSVELERGAHLFDGPLTGGNTPPVFWITFGDASVHATDLAGKETILNYLSVGEPFIYRAFGSENRSRMRLTAMCPVKAIRFEYDDLNRCLKRFEGFRTHFSEHLRPVVKRQHNRFDNSAQKDIARFLVQQRLTFSGRVKLKRMDICIECDGCYEACKTRHGTDRLGPSEVKYGLTEVPQNCHNCVVPECIDKCKFGHISRDPETNEIVIADNCVGCTMCSKGCSYGSIRMHPVSELDIETYFPNRDPNAKGKLIAQKCDNCTGFEDQACISACPTGALFQVDGIDLFNYWQQFNVHERPGFDTVESPETTPRGWRKFWLWFTVLNTAVLTWECLGRLFWPDLTFTTLGYHAGLLAEPLDEKAPFKVGDFFSHSLGYIGAFAMIGTQLYRLRRFTGHTRIWMESHIWLGVLGGIYGFFHTAFVFSDPIAIATFGTMMLAILTGGIGRYLLFLVPRSQAGNQLELDEVSTQIQGLNESIERKFGDRKDGYTAIIRLESLLENVPEDLKETTGAKPKSGFWKGVLRYIDWKRRTDEDIKKIIDETSSSVDRAEVPALSKMMYRKAQLERSVEFQAFLAGVLKRYRIIHVTSSNIMFGALILHVVFALMYQVGG